MHNTVRRPTSFGSPSTGLPPEMPRNIRERPVRLPPVVNIKGDRPPEPEVPQSLLDALDGLAASTPPPSAEGGFDWMSDPLGSQADR